MRTIKFRIWHKVQNRWLDQYLEEDPMINLEGTVLMFERPPVGSWTNVEYISNNLIIQQFTGLLDKNGKEIYEGDIIEWSDNIITKSVVEYENAQFILNIFSHSHKAREKYFTDFRHVNLSKLEIIGNIFENKELLTRTGM